VFRDSLDDIALRQNTGHAAISAGDDYGADFMLRQQMRGVSERFIWRYGRDIAAL
jgi:hypothetical protein